jgi:hypothetical protein
MWGLDKLTVLKLVFLGIVILIAFVQVLYKAFVRPLQSAEEERRRQLGRGKTPPRDIRDFLAEIRGEKAARGPAEPLSPEKNEGEWEVVWQAPDEEVPRPASPPPRSRAQEMPEGSDLFPWQAVESPKKAPPSPQSSRRAEDIEGSQRHVHEYLESLAHEARGAQEGPPGQQAPEASSESTGAPLKGQVETNMEKRLALKYGKKPRAPADRRAVPRLLFGTTLREAWLANVVFGPPRCRRRGPSPRR